MGSEGTGAACWLTVSALKCGRGPGLRPGPPHEPPPARSRVVGWPREEVGASREKPAPASAGQLSGPGTCRVGPSRGHRPGPVLTERQFAMAA